MSTRQSNKLVPYKLLALLLYGQHKWLDRQGSKVSVPVATLARYMGSRANRIKEYLEWLETHGFLSYRWYKHYASVSIVAPVGAEYDIKIVNEYEAEVLNGQ